jgi:beta-phosphoglucomutase-like phosphatase (HAD superfamily)
VKSGVVDRTAQLHAAAWKELFDDFLRQRAGEGTQFQPFDERSDYRAYVDGKPRQRAVRLPARAPRDLTYVNRALGTTAMLAQWINRSNSISAT